MYENFEKIKMCCVINRQVSSSSSNGLYFPPNFRRVETLEKELEKEEEEKSFEKGQLVQPTTRT